MTKLLWKCLWRVRASAFSPETLFQGTGWALNSKINKALAQLLNFWPFSEALTKALMSKQVPVHICPHKFTLTKRSNSTNSFLKIWNISIKAIGIWTWNEPRNRARQKKSEKQRIKKQIFDQTSTIINFNSISFLFSRLNENYLTFWLLEIMTCATPLSSSADSFQHLSINKEMKQKVAAGCYYRIFFLFRNDLLPKIGFFWLWFISRDFSKQTLVDKHLGKISLITSSVESACSSSPMRVTAFRSDPIRKHLRIFLCTKETKATSKESEEDSLIILREGAKVHTLRQVEGNWRTLLSSLYFLRSFSVKSTEPGQSLLLNISIHIFVCLEPAPDSVSLDVFFATNLLSHLIMICNYGRSHNYGSATVFSYLLFSIDLIGRF